MSSPNPPPTPTADDPFRLGWRYVREVGQDGQEVVRQIPLTERDLLFPQEEDFVVQRDAHTRDMLYLREALRTLLADRPRVHVFADHRIDFNLRDIEPLGPDVAVIDGIENWDSTRGTLYLAREGRPLLVAEITSPDTRNNDLGIKRSFYERAGVPIYVIVDRQSGHAENETRLLVLRLNTEGYHPVPPNAEGLIRLPQLRISLSLQDDRVWVHDRTGQRFEETPELFARLAAAEAKQLASDARLQELEVQFEEEVDRRRQEAAARREAEKARLEAERQLNEEREARLAMAERLRQLEEQIRRREDAGGAA